MTELERHAFEEHFFDCAECAADVRAGALMRDGAKAGLLAESGARETSKVMRFEPKATRVPWYRSVVLPWAAAATLAMFTGYQTLRVVPSLRQREATSEALTPVTLRAATRGAETRVSMPPDVRAVTLALDVPNVAATDEIRYEIRDSTDKSVVNGRAAAPTSGSQLLLLIPIWTLTPGEHYILFVASATTNNTLGEYPFVVVR
jgi:hypothetical protein